MWDRIDGMSRPVWGVGRVGISEIVGSDHLFGEGLLCHVYGYVIVVMMGPIEFDAEEVCCSAHEVNGCLFFEFGLEDFFTCIRAAKVAEVIYIKTEV